MEGLNISPYKPNTPLVTKELKFSHPTLVTMFTSLETKSD
jgi:hypothetical protein